MKRRIISILTIAAMLISCTACGAQNTGTAESGTAVEANSTYTGTVSAISTQAITVSTDTGEVTIGLTDATAYSGAFVMGGMNGGMGDIPADMGELPPDMSEIPSDVAGMPDDMGEGMSELPAGEELPDGMMENAGVMDRAQPLEKPDDEPSGEMEQGGAMPELPMGEASQSGITSLNPMDGQSRNATIAIVYIGAAVTVTTDENGCAASVTVSAGEMAMQQLGDIPQMPGDMSAGAERDGADPEFADDASGEGE